MFGRLFAVAAADRAKVALLFLYLLFAVGGSVVVGRSVGRALLLGALPAEAVPLRIVVAALAVVAGTALYSSVGARLPLGRLTVASQLVIGGGLLGLWLLLSTSLGGELPLRVIAFGWIEVVAALTTMQFWILAGQLFDPRSARRSFGLIAAGGPIANVGAGALLAAVAPGVAAADLLLASAATACLCAAAAAVLTRAYPEALGGSRQPRVAPTTGAAEPTSAFRAIAATARSPLLGPVAAIVLLGTAVTNIVDYQLDLALQASFGGDESGMTGFLGAYYVWVGAAAFVVQVGLVSLVLERFGVRAALGALPAGFALGAVAVLTSGGTLLAVAGARASDLLFRFTLNDAGLNMLFLPVSSGARRRAKEALDGIAKPLTAVVLAGLFALVRAAGWTNLAVWSLLVLLLVVVWVWLAARASAAYQAALIDSLRRRRLSFDQVTLDATDPATRAALLAALHGEDEPLALAALQTIADAPGPDWATAVARLLDSPSTDLRVAAAEYLARVGDADSVDALARLLGAPEPAVRAAAVTAISVLGGRIDGRMLADPSAEVRRAATVAMGRAGSAEALAMVRRWASSADAVERRVAAEAIAGIGGGVWRDELARLMGDPRADVVRAALRAAAEVREVALVGAAIDRLGAASTAGAAAPALVVLAEALGSGGRGVADLLVERLADPAADPAVKRAVPALLARLGGERGVAVLRAYAADPDPSLRGAVYAALASGADDEANRRILTERVEPELREAYGLRAAWVDLGPDGRAGLLGEGLEQRLDAALGRLFTLLAALFPGIGVGDAWRGLHSENARSRANAIEVVDNGLARRWRVDLLPLLEAQPERVASLAAERFDLPRLSAADRLAELASGQDRWLRVCALERIGRLQLAELDGVVERAAHAPDSLISETALVAAEALRGETGLVAAAPLRGGSAR